LPLSPTQRRLAFLSGRAHLLAMDSRSLPIDYQMVAFGRGYIPHIPALGPEGTAALMDGDNPGHQVPG
jgi:hypothetical protein